MNVALLVTNAVMLIIIGYLFYDRQKRIKALDKAIDPLVKNNYEQIARMLTDIQQAGGALLLIERIRPDDVFLMGLKKR